MRQTIIPALLFFTLTFVFAQVAYSAQEVRCTISAPPIAVNKEVVITIRGANPTDNYEIEVSPVKYNLQADNNGVIRTPSVSRPQPGAYPVSARNTSGYPDSCNGTLQVFAAPPGGGNTGIGTSIPTPKDWLPTFEVPFGPSPFKGIFFFENNVVGFLISAAFFLLFVLSLIFLMVGGLMLMTSGGNKEGMAKAKATITYALIGLVLGVSAFIIFGVVETFLGTKVLSP